MLESSSADKTTSPVPAGVRVREVLAPVVKVPAPTKSRELISRIDPSTLMFPASPSSLIVIAPVEALTSNSEKSIAVAAPVKEAPSSSISPSTYKSSSPEATPGVPVSPILVYVAALIVKAPSEVMSSPLTARSPTKVILSSRLTVTWLAPPTVVIFVPPTTVNVSP